jgi:hypothetical protein
MGRELLEAVGRSRPHDDPLYCDSLVYLGDGLSHLGKHAEAESLLREALKIMEEKHPDDWNTPCFRSVLGEALSRRKSFTEAERLLLAGHEGLIERSGKIPPEHRPEALRVDVNRLVRFYELCGRPDEADRWRKALPPDPSGPADARKEEARGARTPAASSRGS